MGSYKFDISNVALTNLVTVSRFREPVLLNGWLRDPMSIQYNLVPHPPKYIRSKRPPKHERQALRFDPAPATPAKTFITKITFGVPPSPDVSE